MNTINLSNKVFEQYEYQGYLITIKSWAYGELEGIWVPTKYAHLIQDLNDAQESWRIFEENGIADMETVIDPENGEEYERDIIHIAYFDPFDDKQSFVTNTNPESSSQILNYIINEINWFLRLEPKTIVIKQIYKKSITPKSSKNKRGFNQVAWANMVKLRDGKCMECHSIYDLHAHHIKSFKNHEELRYDVNNGVTLCGQCHRKWHKENGK